MKRSRECYYCKKMFNCEIDHDADYCIGFEVRNERIEKAYKQWREEEAEKMPRKKLTNREKLINENEEAKRLGLDYGTYRAYCDSGYITEYTKRKFHQEVEEHEDPRIVERTFIGSGAREGSCLSIMRKGKGNRDTSSDLWDEFEEPV